jgi:hypothetical protein
MSIDRKAATAAWKERKTAPGIYAIRCVVTGETWLGQAPDVATVQNRHWFALGLGSHSNRALQAAWAQHGADAMVFEVVERLPEEEDAGVRSSQLRNALRRWRDETGAAAV